MYYQDYYVHTYEVDINKRLKVSALLNYFQDAMVHNADSYGAGTDFYQSIGLVWVLIDYEIDITDLPIGKSTITCGTLPYSFKRYFAYRKWEMKDQANNLIASAKGKFVLVDINTKEIVSPTKEIISMFKYSLENAHAVPFSKNKQISGPVIYNNIDTVKTSYIDINNHMNNVYYMIVAYDNIPKDILESFEIEKIRITFKKESLLGEKLIINGRREDRIISFDILNDKTLLSRIRFEFK
jgi:medium-chain acyl-[acyl-carrier-protein] hydrolase